LIGLPCDAASADELSPANNAADIRRIDRRDIMVDLRFLVDAGDWKPAVRRQVPGGDRVIEFAS
jgi:hypothetical protein